MAGETQTDTLDGKGSVTDALAAVLAGPRQRFLSSFPAQCESIRLLVDKVASIGARGPVGALKQVTHRMSGLAGTIGFPTVSARAAELEALVDAVEGGTFDAGSARDTLGAMRAAFASDLESPPDWALSSLVAAPVLKILVAADTSAERTILTTCLQDAGYQPVAVSSSHLLLHAAGTERPTLIILDATMPELDVYATCRLLKADPDLADIAVLVLTTIDNLDHKLAALTLGADEFLLKPVEMRELLLRVQRLLERTATHRAMTARDPCPARELTYEAFLAVANEVVGRSSVAVAIVRLPLERHEEGSLLLCEDLRGRDTICVYGAARRLLLMPEMSSAQARACLEPIIARLTEHGLYGVCVGVTEAVGAGTKTIDALMGEADEALAEARYLDHTLAVWSEHGGGRGAAMAARTVIVAEDDPEVTHIVDAQLRAAGYKTVIAFDGEQALAEVRAHAPAVMVLDLMMPRMNGFAVLTELGKAVETRPRIIVLSARGREEDVLRAFELGADDYMTKPFNPQELTARIARLLK